MAEVSRVLEASTFILFLPWTSMEEKVKTILVEIEAT